MLNCARFKSIQYFLIKMIICEISPLHFKTQVRKYRVIPCYYCWCQANTLNPTDPDESSRIISDYYTHPEDQVYPPTELSAKQTCLLRGNASQPINHPQDTQYPPTKPKTWNNRCGSSIQNYTQARLSPTHPQRTPNTTPVLEGPPNFRGVLYGNILKLEPWCTCKFGHPAQDTPATRKTCMKA